MGYFGSYEKCISIAHNTFLQWEKKDVGYVGDPEVGAYCYGYRDAVRDIVNAITRELEKEQFEHAREYKEINNNE